MNNKHQYWIELNCVKLFYKTFQSYRHFFLFVKWSNLFTWKWSSAATPNHSAINFINVLRAHFLYEILAPKSLKAKTKLCNFWRQNFVPKMRRENVDEIDTWRINKLMSCNAVKRFPRLTDKQPAKLRHNFHVIL